MKQLCKRLSAALLALLFALSAALPALAEDTPETLAITSAEDLLALQNRCLVDTATRDLTVRLETDLDLTGREFTGLPVFSGHFDGQGHTITGLSLAGGSVQGFFRYLESTAVVENLNLEGSAGDTDAEILGLLAGENRGLVRNCTTAGQVTAAREAGGLVGRNEAGGQLVSCCNQAAVQADRMAGGLAGQNLGSILRCENRGAVNTTLTAAADQLVGISLSGEDGSSLAAVSDMGGIAGRSEGILQSCTNTGPVGYDAVGDNVGGIVGRTSGYLEGCVNSGTVQGSQDVGGVAGQLEPVLTLQYDTGKLDTLYRELDTLQGQMETLLTDLDGNGDQISSALDALTGATRTAKDNTSALTDSMVRWADDGIQTINSTASRFSWAIDRLSPVFSDLGTALDQGEAAAAALERFLQDSAAAAGLTPEMRARLETACRTFADACAQARTAWNRAQTALQVLLDSLGDDSASTAAWNDLADALQALRTALDQMRQSAADLAGLLDELLANGTVEAPPTQTPETAQTTALSQEGVDAARADLSAARTALGQVVQALQEAVSGMESVTTGLAGQPTVTVSPLDSAVGAQGDALNASLGTLLDGFAALNTAVTTASDTAVQDLRAVNDQLGRVVDAARALTDDPRGQTLFADLSREQAEQQLAEQGDGCLANAGNSGDVTGQNRVGGIVGSLTSELDTDPEGHWQQDGDGSALSAEVQLRLIVLDCHNSGTVTADKEEAGGIAGRMDFGYTAGCENGGDVTGTTAVGGVVGHGEGIVEDCWVRCALQGTQEVGGVAGYGKEINRCRTMVELLPAEEGQPLRYAGTIAGRLDEDAALADNRYIHDSLGAVDGVTRAAQALPAGFEELAADPDAPDDFARLELTFVADGQTVATVTFRYGEGVTSLPAVPQKDGYVGRWPDLDYTHLTYSQTVEAEYTPYASALADDSGETPQVLVDGSFSPQATVDVTTGEVSFADADGHAHSGTAYTVTVTDPLFGAPDCTVHFRKPDTAARYTVWVQQGDTWEARTPGVDGSYLLIDCPGGQITFMAEETAANLWLAVLAAAGILLVAAVFVIRWLRHHRKKPSPPPAGEPRT